MNLVEGSCGQWQLKRFTVEKKDLIGQMGSMWRTGRFTPPGEYMSLLKKGALWMSNTPDEMHDHYAFIRRAHGRCLVTGLGLGMCVSAVLDSSQCRVEHITIIEIDPDVITLVGSQLIEQYAEKVTIIQADALEYKPEKGTRYNVAWHDIWQDICEDNLPQMMKMHRKYGRFADWQGSWSKAALMRMKQRRHR